MPRSRLESCAPDLGPAAGAIGALAVVSGTEGQDWIHVAGDGHNPPNWTWNEITTATGEADSIAGGGRRDFIFAGGGDDTIQGGFGADALYGGAGNDTAIYENWRPGRFGVTVYLNGRPGSGSDAEGDTLHGIENVIGTYNSDVLYGDSFDNILNGAGDIFGDTLYGGGGNDTLISNTHWRYVSELYGGAGGDLLQGGSHGRDIAAYDEADWGDLVISLADPSLSTGAAAGDSYVNIRTVRGGSGNDTIIGRDNESNILNGGGGDDSLFGLTGDDILAGSRGNDTLDGGDGVDVADFSDRTRPIVLTLDSLAKVTVTISDTEQDTLRNIEGAIGGSGGDTLTGDDFANVLSGGGGNDTLRGGGGQDTLTGGIDYQNRQSRADPGDTADYSDKTLPVVVDISVAYSFRSDGVWVGGVHEDNIILIENIIGGSADDDLSGSKGNNTLAGGAGNDLLTGEAGNDSLLGGTGDDWLRGNTGNDNLAGGDGNDRISGGDGNNVLRGGAGDDTYLNPRTGSDTLIEGAGGGVDTIQSDISLSLQAFSNVERLDLIGSADIDGGGGDGHDVISGNAGANVLTGGAGRDTLNGGAGNDTLVGGEGNDRLTGGEGADVFAFAPSGTNADLIKDFAVAEDRFDLAGGVFTALEAVGGGIKLTHAGGTVLVHGVTGLSLADWNALVVVPAGRVSGWVEPATLSDSPYAFAPDAAQLAAQQPFDLAFLAHADFLGA